MKVVFAGLEDDPAYRLLARETGGFEFSAVPLRELGEVKWADVLIAPKGQWGRDELAGMRISLLQRFGVGVDTVDLDAANQLGIWVANVPSLPSGNADAVADLAIFHLIGLSRQAKVLFHAVEQGSWRYPIGQSLKGRTACIVGMGGLGLAIAVRLHAMGMRLIGVRKNPHKIRPEEIHFESVYAPGGLSEALSRCYCAILAAPMDGETYRLIGEEELCSMPHGSLLINVSRGGLVDEEALIRHLDSGHLGGAGLDVFEDEPLDSSSPLAHHPAVIATPHCGGVTHESMKGIAAYIGNNLRHYAAGKKLGSIVNDPIHPKVKLL